MAAPIEIDVWQGDIGELEVDAIIIPASESLFMTGPVAAGVKRHAGPDVERDAVAQGPAPLGSAVVTGGGDLASPYVIHAVAVGHDLRPDRDAIGRAIRAALDAAARLQLRRLACAPLGTERGVFDADESATLLLDAIGDHVAAGAPLDAVVFVVGGADQYAAFAEAVRHARAAAT